MSIFAAAALAGIAIGAMSNGKSHSFSAVPS